MASARSSAGSSISSDTSFDNGMTQLLVATRYNDLQQMRQLLQSGEDPNKFEHKCKWTPLIAAASRNSPEALQLLLDHRANINWLCNDGSALAIAANYGHEAAVRLLLSRKARVDLVTSDGYGATAFAVQNGHFLCLRLLLDAGADVNACTSEGHSLLLIAARYKRPDATNLLLQRSADPNRAENRFNWTPLMTAVFEDCEAIVDLLIMCNQTNLDQVGRDGTALALAAAKNNIAMATKLLQAGAQVKVEDLEGYTPLLWSAQNGHQQMVQLLLNNGASLLHKNKAGHDAILVAACNGNKTTLGFLLNHAKKNQLHSDILPSVQTTLNIVQNSAENFQSDPFVRDSIIQELNAFLGEKRRQLVENPTDKSQSNNRNEMVSINFSDRNVDKDSRSLIGSTINGSIRGVNMRAVIFTPVLPRDLLRLWGLRSEKMEFVNHGNFGWVYKAERSDGKLLVLKLVSTASRDRFSFDGGDKEKFLNANKREIEIMKSINHKNVVQFHNAELVGEYLVICMEYISGHNLREHRSKKGGFGELDILKYLKQICDGIAYIHQKKICHRDIKGENLMVQLPEDNVKIIDFGLSKRLHEHDNLHSHVGTPMWMAPEVLCTMNLGSRSNYNPLAADVYSLGCTLHELSTGNPPSSPHTNQDRLILPQFDRDGQLPVTELAKYVSKPLCMIFQKCTNKRPEYRPSVEQLLLDPIFSNQV